MNTDPNWLRNVLAVVQNDPVDFLTTRSHAANSNKGNAKFVHDGRIFFKHRDLKGNNVGIISTMYDQATISGCRGRAWFNQDGTFIKIVTAHGCEADPSRILSTAVRNEEKHLAKTTTMGTGAIINQVRNQARVSGSKIRCPKSSAESERSREQEMIPMHFVLRQFQPISEALSSRRLTKFMKK